MRPTGFWGVRDPNHNAPQIPDLRGIIGGGGGNRTHVRGTPVAGFSVCSRRFNLTPPAIVRRTPSGPSPKNLGHRVRAPWWPSLSNSVNPQTVRRNREVDVAELSSQCVVVIGS